MSDTQVNADGKILGARAFQLSSETIQIAFPTCNENKYEK